MERISGSHYFLNLFTNSTPQQLPLTALSQRELVFHSILLRVYVRRIFSSNSQNLKFDHSTPVTWKRRATGKPDLFEQAQIFAGTATLKLTNTPAFNFFSLLDETINIVLFRVIYSSLKKFFKISVLKNLAKFTGNHQCGSLFLISLQPATF